MLEPKWSRIVTCFINNYHRFTLWLRWFITVIELACKWLCTAVTTLQEFVDLKHVCNRFMLVIVYLNIFSVFKHNIGLSTSSKHSNKIRLDQGPSWNNVADTTIHCSWCSLDFISAAHLIQFGYATHSARISNNVRTHPFYARAIPKLHVCARWKMSHCLRARVKSRNNDATPVWYVYVLRILGKSIIHLLYPLTHARIPTKCMLEHTSESLSEVLEMCLTYVVRCMCAIRVCTEPTTCMENMHEAPTSDTHIETHPHEFQS